MADAFYIRKLFEKDKIVGSYEPILCIIFQYGSATAGAFTACWLLMSTTGLCNYYALQFAA